MTHTSVLFAKRRKGKASMRTLEIQGAPEVDLKDSTQAAKSASAYKAICSDSAGQALTVRSRSNLATRAAY